MTSEFATAHRLVSSACVSNCNQSSNLSAHRIAGSQGWSPRFFRHLIFLRLLIQVCKARFTVRWYEMPVPGLAFLKLTNLSVISLHSSPDEDVSADVEDALSFVEREHPFPGMVLTTSFNLWRKGVVPSVWTHSRCM